MTWSLVVALLSRRANSLRKITKIVASNALFGSDNNQIVGRLGFARDPTVKASGGSKGGGVPGVMPPLAAWQLRF